MSLGHNELTSNTPRMRELLFIIFGMLVEYAYDISAIYAVTQDHIKSSTCQIYRMWVAYN